MTMLTRRGVLAIGAGVVITATAMGFGVREAMSRGTLVRRTLEDYLGPFRMDENELEAFTDGFAEDSSDAMLGSKLAVAVGGAAAVGLEEPVRSLLPAEEAEEFERFERELLASFYTTTTYPYSGPNDPIQYMGTTACGNPFARFD